jgi:hypothetical protein
MKPLPAARGLSRKPTSIELLHARALYIRAFSINWWWVTTAIAVIGTATAVPIAPCFKFESLFEFCN